MADDRRMQDRRVLVTGSGTGIGRGVALQFAKAGATVAIHYSHSAAGAEAAVEQIRNAGGNAQAFQADFAQVEQVKQLASQAIDFLGGLDVLINNAGITINMPFEKVTLQQYDTLYDVNVRAQFFLTQAALPAMAAQGKGAVINVNSVQAFGGLREHSVYAGTKGAILAYTRELSLELAPKGIRVNGIAPGWICVENERKTVGEDFDWEEAGKELPAGFIGDPVDVAELAIFLASDEARFIIGQTYVIDGGQLAILPATGDFREPMTDQFGQGYVPGLKERKVTPKE